ncbi:MAG TPA: methyltransferase type 12 [Actinobacteria bacterium]|nr:methyltransferase type 12 [Actinomycetota bacterium]HCK79068.1 methyltransferase type 12 [Actinomycetota bacterium]
MADEQPPSEIRGDQQTQDEALEDLTLAINYRRWLTSLAAPYLGDNPLEIGSGNGDYAAEWLKSGIKSLTVSELEPARLDGLRQRFSGDDRVHVRRIDATNVDGGPYSAVVSFNVLEHIANDVQALRSAAAQVIDGGRIFAYVPAFNFALSNFDRQLGHVRRYTKSTISNAFEQAGLTPEVVRYVNAPGLPAWFIGMKILGLTPGNGPLLRVWDGAVIPMARAVEGWIHPPFGQSVLAVAQVRRHEA